MCKGVVIKGIVNKGNKVGSTVGLPTANLDYRNVDNKVEDGVYAVKCTIFRKVDDGEVLSDEYLGVTNIGTKPSVEDTGERTVETHIIDFDEDIYGMEFSIKILGKIRDIHKFAGIKAVKEQVEKDILVAKEMAKNAN